MWKLGIAVVVVLAACTGIVVVENAGEAEPVVEARSSAAASRSAHAILDAALMEAKNDDRRVLLVFGATW